MAGRLSEHMEKVWEQFTPRAELRPADVIKARFRAALTPGHLESRKEMSALSNSDLTGSCPG